MSTVTDHSINTVYLCLLQYSIILAKKCRYIDCIRRETMGIGLYLFDIIREYV
jgi:hypothetical protein